MRDRRVGDYCIGSEVTKVISSILHFFFFFSFFLSLREEGRDFWGPPANLSPLSRASHLCIVKKISLAMVDAVVIMPSVTCTRLSLGDGGRRLYVRTEWLDAGFAVTALDFPQAWSCNVTKADVEERASRWDISVDEYLHKSRLYLSSQHPESTYSFSELRDEKMRFSWTTKDVKNDLVLVVNLTMSKERDIIPFIPRFLDGLGDVNEELKDMQEVNKKAEKNIKARQVAMKFRATERNAQKHKKKNLCKQVLTRQVFNNEGFDNLEIADPLPNKGLNYNTCTLTYEPPPSSVDSQTRGLSAAAPGCSDRYGVTGYQTSQVNPRVYVATETPRSPMMAPRYRDGSVRGSQPAYSAEKVALADSLASSHPDHHQMDLSFNPMSLVAKNARGSHRQFKSMPLEYENQRLMGEQRGKGVHIPLKEEYCLGFSNKASSSPLKTPVKVDMDIAEGLGVQAKRCEDSAMARSYELRQPWAQFHIPGRLSNVDVSMVRCERMPPMLESKGSLQKVPTRDKGVIALETKKTGLHIPNVSGGKGGKPNKALGSGGEHSVPAKGKGHGLSHARGVVILLSDSEEEGGLEKLADGDGLQCTSEDMLEREKQAAFEELFDEREGDEIAYARGSAQEKTITQIIQDANNGELYSSSITIMGNRSKRGPQGACFAESFKKSKTESVGNVKVKDEKSSWRGEREGGSWPGNLGKRKERSDSVLGTDVWGNNFVDSKHTKTEDVWLEEQQPCILRRNKRELDAQAYVGGDNKATFEELQHEEDFSEKPMQPMGGCKVPVNVNESRAQWNTWIKEAKTEVTVWEAPSRDRDIRNGGTAHEESPIRNRDIRNTDSVHEGSPIRNRLSFKNNGGLLHEEAPIRNRDLRNGGSVHEDAPHRSRGIRNGGLMHEEAPHRINRDLRNNGGFMHEEAPIRNRDRDVRNGGTLYEEAPHRTRDFRNGGSVHLEALIRNRESRVGVSVHEEASIRNRDSRSGVLVHEEEAPNRSPDARNGGLVHEEAQRIWSPLHTSPVRDLKILDTPPSVKKAERRNDVSDTAKVQPKRLQPMFEPVNNNGNISNRETLEVSERKLEEGLVEQSNFKEMMMEGSNREVAVEDDVQFENKNSEREFVQIEEESDGGRDMDMEGESGDELVFKPGERGDCKGIPRMGDTVANVLVNRDKKLRLRKLCEKKSLGKDSLSQKTPGRRGRPPGRSLSLTNSRQPFSQGRGRPPLRPMDYRLHSPVSDFESMLVLPDQNLQTPVPDSDFYCFDNDRMEEHIKPNEVWALYDPIDEMPRTWVRVKKVHALGSPFEVKATWLEPDSPCEEALERQKASGFSISLGDFREAPGGPSIIKTSNCFSHKMQYVQVNETIVQIYPRVGEVWALHRKVRKRENSEKSKSGDDTSFRLVVISSECGRGQPSEIRVLKKRTGYRTLWEPGYQPGPLPLEYIHLFSHKVPAYKLRDKDFPDLMGLDCWDIDAAAIPMCQSFVT